MRWKEDRSVIAPSSLAILELDSIKIRFIGASRKGFILDEFCHRDCIFGQNRYPYLDMMYSFL